VERSESVGVEMTFEIFKPGYRLVPNFHVFFQEQYAFVSSPPQIEPMAPGLYKTTMWIPAHFLNHGFYVVGIALTSLDPLHIHFELFDALRFHVSGTNIEDAAMAVPGPVRPAL